MPAFFVGVKNIGFADQGFRLATPKINMRVLLNLCALNLWRTFYLVF